MTSFAAIVRSPAAVRSAFADVPFIRTWWRIVLALHGKPTATDGPEAAREVIAAGFVFYSRLYAMLGAVFLILCAATFRIAIDAHLSYWMLLGFAAGGYLLLSATVARKGAQAFRESRVEGIACLVLFLAMIIVFLAMFLASVSIVAASLSLVPHWVNILVFAGMSGFGIGSYLLELLYLVHVARTASAQPDEPQ